MSEYPGTVQCPVCGDECAFTPRPDTQHWGSIKCQAHGFRWIPKPAEGQKPRRKTNASLRTALPEGMTDFCWVCLRDEPHLKALRPAVVLQVHHITPVEEGGGDEPENLQILCAECHAEVHRRREAFMRYRG